MSYEIIFEPVDEDDLGMQLYIDVLQEIIKQCLSEEGEDEKGGHLPSGVN